MGWPQVVEVVAATVGQLQDVVNGVGPDATA